MIYEIINKGKGLITEIAPENLFLIKKDSDGSETKLTGSSNISITGIGTELEPYIIHSSNVQSVTGDNVDNTDPLNPVINQNNLQKVIVYPADFIGTNYTLTNADNNYEIIVDNGATAVSITVPSGLVSKIGMGFTQKGSGDISYIPSGTTINNPTGLKIKGQYYQTFLSQELATNSYYLGGNTKV